MKAHAPLALSRRRFLIGAAASASLPFLASCASPFGGAAKPSASGDVITFVVGTDPPSMDPGNDGPPPQQYMGVGLFDRLVNVAPDQTLSPGLATDWAASPDGMKWTFHLRKGAQFHDGTPVDANAVKFSIDRVLAEKPLLAGRRYVSPYIKSVAATDDSTVELTLVQPFPALPVLAGSQLSMSIVSPKAVQDYGEDFGRHPVGSGPFVLKEWVSGQRVVLERNEKYWGTKAKPFQVVYAPVKEAATRASMLETGQADLIENVLPADAKRLSANADTQIIKVEALEVSQIRFNMLDEKFKDTRVRQALNYAINMQQIIDTALDGVGTFTSGPMPKLVPGAITNGKYHYDPAMAKDLLAQAGFANGFKTSLSFNPATITGLNDMAQALQALWKAVGIDVALNPLDADAYTRFNALPAEQAQQKQLMFQSSTYRFADPVFMQNSFHSSQWPPQGSNYGFYKNPRVDMLLDQGQTEADPAKRTSIYQQAQELLVDDPPVVFVFTANYLFAARKLKDVHFPPNQQISFSGISKA